MKTNSRIFILILPLLLLSAKAYQQNVIGKENLKSIVGDYRSAQGYELLKLDRSSFHLVKLKNKLFDVALPNCDTIARGKWHFFKPGILKLNNDTAFEKIDFSVSQATKFSQDSVYIKILLPAEVAFFDGRFRYDLALIGKINFIDSNSNLIAFAKEKVFFSNNLYYHIGLTIQDLDPLNCTLNGKCFQRIYFKIFDDFELDSKLNYFTITINNFNECYVERMDVDDELLIVDKNNIYWRGMVYRKMR